MRKPVDTGKFDQIRANDRAALALVASEGIGIGEAYVRVFNGLKTETSVNRTPVFGVSERAE